MIGKRADLRISDRVFGHALRLKNNVRSKSTGSFISQIRELESVRELITSTTIGAVADLPFFLLFVFILWMIGGWLVLVVLLALPLLVIPACWYNDRWRGWRTKDARVGSAQRYACRGRAVD